MTKASTQGELADFRAFCQQATDIQLREITEKEAAAGRQGFADVARMVWLERGKPGN